MNRKLDALSHGTGGMVHPVSQQSRITIIDSLRGIALLGILLMNIPYFGMPYQAGYNLEVKNEFTGINYYTWWIINTGFEGTMRGLFSLLFGAGAILLLSRLDKNKNLNPADIYYRRLIWLLIFGLINAFIFLWPGDILYAYAICGLFLFPFRKMRARYLLLFAALFLGIQVLRGSLSRIEMVEVKTKGEQAIALEKNKQILTEEQKDDKQAWVGMQEKMKIENVRKAAEKEQREMQKGYLSIMEHQKPWNVKFQSKKLYQWNFFDIMLFMFLGMAFYKMGVLTGESSKLFYMLMVIIGYAAGIGLAYWLNHMALETRFNMVLLFERMPLDLYQVKRILLSIGHIGLVMLVYKSGWAHGVLGMLARVGQMAFSNYLMQSLICIFIFYGFGFRWFGYLERYQLYLVVAGIWLFQVVFSNVWLAYFRFGPFEWAWRSLTYWKRQPLLKVNANTLAEPYLASGG